MEEETFLTDEFLRQLINVGEVDILVGLPTHNNAKTIGSIVQTIRSGILQGFPRERTVIINADGGSRDGTPDLVTDVSIQDARPASNLTRCAPCTPSAQNMGATRRVAARCERFWPLPNCSVPRPAS